MKKSFQKILNYNMSWVWTIISISTFLCICLAIIGIILGSIALKNTNTLEDDKQSKEPFENWLIVNATLYKNDKSTEIILIEDVPIKYTQIDKQVLIRLPVIYSQDTSPGTLSYFRLYLTNENRLPVIALDSQAGAQTNLVWLMTTSFFVNDSSLDTRLCVIKIKELFILGQIIEYDFIVGYSPMPENTSVFIDGGLSQYETTLSTHDD